MFTVFACHGKMMKRVERKGPVLFLISLSISYFLIWQQFCSDAFPQSNIADKKADRPRVFVFHPTLSPKNTSHYQQTVPPIGMNAGLSREIRFDEYHRPFVEECKPMREWQTRVYSTCNVIHELNIAASNHDNGTALVLSQGGSWRLVWKVPLDQEVVVLKMLHYHREFEDESYPLATAEAIAMERLTSSPYAVTAYGFCGQSIISEFAPGSIKHALHRNQESLGIRDRIVLARALARGMYHMHYMDGTSEPTFCHRDINISNLVQTLTGQIKYNDFNIGVLLRYNATSQKPCGFPVDFGGAHWRSPEEIRGASYVSEKLDIFALGNVYYLVLTSNEPWTSLEPTSLSNEEVIAKKAKGHLPFLPEEFANSTRLEDRALRIAYRACYQFDPEHRPSALVILRAFDQVIDWGNRQKEVTESELRKIFRLVE